MNCMKCGRDLKDQQVFCNRCLTEMERYPVKPNVVVQLPVQHAAPAVKKPPRKPEVKPEETIRRLRSLVRWLVVFSAVLLILLALAVNFLLYNKYKPENDPDIGKNYTTQVG